jgi:hypothetical protein
MSAIDLLSGSSHGDRALFHMGLIWAHPDNPNRDYSKALGYLQQVARDFPNSALLDESRVVEGSVNEILLRDSKIKENEKTINALTKQLGSMTEIQTGIEGKNEGLEETIKALKKQLNAMKEIDLGIEEKKREDSPAKTNR